MRQVYRFYLKKALPAIGKRFSKDPEAYRYLSESIQRFPAPALFNERLASAGFETEAPKRMTFGAVTLYEAKTTSMQ